MRNALHLAVAIAMLLCGAVTPAQRSDSSERLLSLCRLWNSVRFIDPDLSGEADPKWDDALVSSIPLLAQPDGLRASARAMLAHLHDPLTRLDGPSPGSAPAVIPSFRYREGIEIINVRGYPSGPHDGLFATRLRAAIARATSARGVIIDLRAAALPGPDQLDTALDAWDEASLPRAVSASSLPRPRLSHREYIGFPQEYPPPRDNNYRAVVAPRISAFSDGAEGGRRDVPVALLVDRFSLLPPVVTALAQWRGATLFSEDTIGDTALGTTDLLPQQIDAGNGLRATIRVEAPDPRLSVRRGSVEAAIAWVKSHPSSPVHPPQVPPINLEALYADPSLPNRTHRTLAVCRIWGTIAYLYPYRATALEEWDAAFRTATADLDRARDTQSYALALMRFYAHLHDGHGNISARGLASFGGVPPLVAIYVEERLVVQRVDLAWGTKAGIAPGDEIVTVDGEPVRERADRMRPYINASTEQWEERQLADPLSGNPAVLSGPVGSIARLQFRASDGRLRTIELPRERYRADLHRRPSPATRILSGQIGYIDLDQVSDSTVDDALRRTSHSRALILDLRTHPLFDIFTFAGHFAEGVTPVARFRTPILRPPYAYQNDDPAAPEKFEEFVQSIDPVPPRYARPVIGLIDRTMISAAEHLALLLKQTANARFVGEPTAGANGQVTAFQVPGFVLLPFTGQQVEWFDGRPVQRVGIQPDVSVTRTVEGIRAGRDEIYEAGIREALRVATASP